MSALRNALASIDTSVLEWMHRHATPLGLAVSQAVSHLGSPIAMTILAFGGAFALTALGEWILLGGWVAAFSGTSLLDRWLKLAVHRPRPVYATAVLHHPSWSFPSGHAMGSLVGYGMLAYVLITLVARRHRRAQVAIAAAAGVLILAIGVSRLYLGVHYVSDVVGGFGTGLLLLLACISAVEALRRWQRQPLRLHPTG